MEPLWRLETKGEKPVLRLVETRDAGCDPVPAAETIDRWTSYDPPPDSSVVPGEPDPDLGITAEEVSELLLGTGPDPGQASAGDPLIGGHDADLALPALLEESITSGLLHGSADHQAAAAMGDIQISQQGIPRKDVPVPTGSAGRRHIVSMLCRVARAMPYRDDASYVLVEQFISLIRLSHLSADLSPEGYGVRCREFLSRLLGSDHGHEGYLSGFEEDHVSSPDAHGKQRRIPGSIQLGAGYRPDQDLGCLEGSPTDDRADLESQDTDLGEPSSQRSLVSPEPDLRGLSKIGHISLAEKTPRSSIRLPEPVASVEPSPPPRKKGKFKNIGSIYDGLIAMVRHHAYDLDPGPFDRSLLQPENSPGRTIVEGGKQWFRRSGLDDLDQPGSAPLILLWDKALGSLQESIRNSLKIGVTLNGTHVPRLITRSMLEWPLLKSWRGVNTQEIEGYAIWAARHLIEIACIIYGRYSPPKLCGEIQRQIEELDAGKPAWRKNTIEQFVSRLLVAIATAQAKISGSALSAPSSSSKKRAR